MAEAIDLLQQRLTELLALASPTYQEQAIVAWLKDWAKAYPLEILEDQDSLVFQFAQQPGKPHLALVGHTDVVPAHFEPYIAAGRLHGSGASDMKGALAAYLVLVEQYGQKLLENYNLSLIFYAREEMTPLKENGLYHLLQAFPDYFKSVDLALIGEPTDNTIQLGCVGSIHMQVTIPGVACHSARPWNGENALYNALPFIQQMAQLKPIKHTVFGVDFYDVLQITESESDKGRTTLPGKWQCNVNYRFAPVRSEAEAQAELKDKLIAFGAQADNLKLIDTVPSGRVIESEFFAEVVKTLGAPIEAKQAWTDVAQLTAQGIPAFNFGPGLTAQTHKDNEYILLKDLETYYHDLTRLFEGL